MEKDDLINDLLKYVKDTISVELLKYVAEKAVETMQGELDNADISTNTMQRYCTYQVYQNNTAKVFIDFALLSAYEADMPSFNTIDHRLVEWGRFANTYNGRSTKNGLQNEPFWRGELVSFRLAEWMEKGGKGRRGNQPITGTYWFSNTVKKVNASLDKWVREYFAGKGITLA